MYIGHLEKQTEDNKDFRHVLETGKHLQLVAMSLKPGEDIGLEKHDVDQFFRIESGEATLVIEGKEHIVNEGGAVIVPAGTEHNVMNRGGIELKLYTLYSSPQHPAGTVEKTKEEAQA